MAEQLKEAESQVKAVHKNVSEKEGLNSHKKRIQQLENENGNLQNKISSLEMKIKREQSLNSLLKRKVKVLISDEELYSEIAELMKTKK